MNSKSGWKAYNSAGSSSPARPRLVNTLNKFFTSTPGRALDIGCGGGRDTRELLARGWTVDAIDDDDSAIELTSKLKEEWPDRLNVVR